MASDVIRIRVDEIRNGELFRRCPKCGATKEINDFGLRRHVGAALGGADIISTQSWCKTCRSTPKNNEDIADDDTDVG